MTLQKKLPHIHEVAFFVIFGYQFIPFKYEKNNLTRLVFCRVNRL